MRTQTGIFPFLQHSGRSSGFSTTSNDDISGELIILLRPYVSNRKVFYCPVVDVYNKYLTYEYQSEKQNPRYTYIGYYYYCCDDWSHVRVSQSGSTRRILMSCIGGGVTNGKGWCGHGYNVGIYTFTDGHCKYIHHYNYPDRDLNPTFPLD